MPAEAAGLKGQSARTATERGARCEKRRCQFTVQNVGTVLLAW